MFCLPFELPGPRDLFIVLDDVSDPLSNVIYKTAAVEASQTRWSLILAAIAKAAAAATVTAAAATIGMAVAAAIVATAAATRAVIPAAGNYCC